MSYLSSDEFQKSASLGATWPEVLADHPEISVEQKGGVWVAAVPVERAESLRSFLQNRRWGAWEFSGLSADGCSALFFMEGKPTSRQVEDLVEWLQDVGVYAGR